MANIVIAADRNTEFAARIHALQRNHCAHGNAGITSRTVVERGYYEKAHRILTPYNPLRTWHLPCSSTLYLDQPWLRIVFYLTLRYFIEFFTSIFLREE